MQIFSTTFIRFSHHVFVFVEYYSFQIYFVFARKLTKRDAFKGHLLVRC